MKRIVKITSKTPKGKAKKSSQTFKKAICGVLKEPLKTVVTSDREFYYILEIENDDQMTKLNRRIALAETQIKQFHKMLIKTIKWTNKMASRGSWAFKKVKRAFIRKIEKLVQDKKSDFVKDLQEESDKGIEELLNVKDLKEMQEFLKQDLITLEEIEYGNE